MNTNFNQFKLNEEEGTNIRFPNSLEYWRGKGKRGKEVVLYTHDDCDGIFSAIAMKEYLLAHGFTIHSYGVINYTESWKVFNIDTSYINICVDFSEDHPDLDLYIDHHMDEGELYKKSEYSIKMKSDSCYGLVTYLLGMPTDSMILSVISMIDAAKYDEYNVDIKTILNFNLNDIIRSKNPRLVFAGAFNQLIKRSDYKTIIEVIHNGNLSIYKIFQLFKKFYPLNNLQVKRGADKENIRQRIIGGIALDDPDQLRGVPEFVPDSMERIGKMTGRTVGANIKTDIRSFEQFEETYWDPTENRLKFDGFVLIKNLIFVPVGTWANALRARALVEKTLGHGDRNVQFILLDYGSSLQIASYKNIETMTNLPVLTGGEVLDDLDKYTKFLLNFVLRKVFEMGYEGAKAGGHKGIGNLSNILGKCQKPHFNDIKYLDIIKNWIIQDITGIKWKLNMKWSENLPEERDIKKTPMNQKMMTVDQVRKIKM
jgi:hypothetical protein